MMPLKTATLLPLVLVTSAVLTATDAAATMVDPKFCRGSQPFVQPPKVASATAPVYVGGVRYFINQTQMTPLYRYHWVPVPPPHISERCWRVVDGLTIQIPVDGDAGQRLLFDINGRSGRDGVLTASCGSFSATDSGNKFVISSWQTTGGSCRSMRLDLRNVDATTTLDLSIQIAEQL